MIDQKELAELQKNDPVDHYLLIRKSEIRTTKAGKDYLSLELGDKSTSLNANVWDNFEAISKSSKTGDVVKVSGSIEEFQGSPQIRISHIRITNKSDKVSPSDFLPRSKRDLKVMENEFLGRIEELNSHLLKTLIKNIFNEDRFNKFKNAPAGKSWHHGYLHGLLEHSLEIIKICDLMCDMHNELNRDLLISGAMLHDFGKIEELTFDSAFEYNSKGKLIGHIVIAAIIVNTEAEKIEGFSEELINNLLHLILSHQGKLEHASPVVPKTAEAIALYQADELSAKVNAYLNAINTEQKSDENWTRYITLAQTDLHKHGLESDQFQKKSLFD